MDDQAREILKEALEKLLWENNVNLEHCDLFLAYLDDYNVPDELLTLCKVDPNVKKVFGALMNFRVELAIQLWGNDDAEPTES